MRCVSAVVLLAVAAVCTPLPSMAQGQIADDGPRGMTWGNNPVKTGHKNIVLVSCHGKPASPAGSCDAYKGDTSCSVELPLLCLKVDGRARPAGLPNGSDSPSLAMPGRFYSGWAAGEVAATPAIAGSRLRSRAAADALCSDRFGTGWRMAEFHDGLVDGSDAGGSAPQHGGWAYYAQGRLSAKTRYWVAISDTGANCWNQPAPTAPPKRPLPEQHLAAPKAKTND